MSLTEAKSCSILLKPILLRQYIKYGGMIIEVKIHWLFYFFYKCNRTRESTDEFFHVPFLLLLCLAKKKSVLKLICYAVAWVFNISNQNFKYQCQKYYQQQ